MNMITIENNNLNPLLSKYIRKISVFRSRKPITYRQKLIPSAFTYLSYNHKDMPVSVFGKKKVHPQRRLQIAGPKINEHIYVEYNGTLEQILIEFTASGFYYLFHESPSQFINSLYCLDDILLPTESEKLNETLKRSNTVQRKIHSLERFLLKRSSNAIPPCEYVENSLKLIGEARGNITIKELIDKLSISERQLERRFREVVGITPKQFAKIVQLHFVINLMYIKKYNTFQDIAYFASYYDLAHFYHIFKDFTGFSPVEFINSDEHLAFEYFTDLGKKF
jgi:AraC-like DNA-binding protein